MAKFKDGESGNPKGRPAGTPNKVTGDVRETIKAALAGVDAETLTAKMKQLQGKDYIDAYTKLAEFVTPKLARTTLSSDEEGDGTLTLTLNLNGPAKADG